MKRKRIRLGWMISSTISAIVLSACGIGTPAEPTLDPNMVFTEVAETVMVSMTQTAEAIPPTPTPEPTATSEPTRTPKPTLETASVQPAVTTAPQQFIGDKAAWLSNNPADGQTFPPGYKFQLTVCFKNVGSTEWSDNNKCYLEYASGFVLWNGQSRWYIDEGETIKPGEKWCFTLHAVTASEPGEYITRYFMKNPEGIIMEEFYFPFKVAQ